MTRGRADDQFHNVENDLGQKAKQGLTVSPYGEREFVETPQSDVLETSDPEQHAPINQAELDSEFAAHGIGRIPPGAGDRADRRWDDQGWEDVDEPSKEGGQWRTAAGAKVGETSSAHHPKKPKLRKRFTGTAASPAVHTPGDASSSTHADRRGGGRKLINQFRRGGKHNAKPAKVDVGAPSMTNEMLAGQLPVMILKTWLDRDDEGHRAVPVLLGNLRFRIGDSVSVRSSGRNSGKELFKIECEYGDGAIKWVIYRDLRDFVSLHTHYKTANFGHRVTRSNVRHVDIPEFPRNGELVRDAF